MRVRATTGFSEHGGAPSHAAPLARTQSDGNTPWPNTKARRLLVNGRFLGGEETAVNAVALELTLALYKRLLLDGSRWSLQLVIPPDLQEEARLTGLPFRVVGRLTGIPWEQLVLPRIRHEGLILNLFNTVPLLGTGYVTLVHDAHVVRTPASYPKVQRWWRRRLLQRAGHRDNALLTVSEASAEALRAHGIVRTNRFGIVPNGVGAVAQGKPDHAILKRLRLDPDTSWCVAQASLLPHKNLAVLLQAFADPRLADVPLVLFGRATRTDVQGMGLTPSPNVLFAGFIPDRELTALYRGALAVCVPSTEEGFGLPALEGMALGAVPLVADRGALPGVVGDAGIVLPHNQPEAWVWAVTKLVADPHTRHTLIARGRERAALFTWDEAARRLLAHLNAWN